MGVFFKFFGVYLKNLSFSDEQIALINMILPIIHIIITMFMGYIANQFNLGERILKILTFLSFVVSILYLFVDVLFIDLFTGFFILTIFFAIFRNPILPLVDSTTLENIMHEGGDYGKIRLWGSLGFIIGTVIVGVLLDFKEVFSFNSILYVMCIFLFMSFLSSLNIPAKVSGKTGISLREIINILKDKEIILFLFVNFLHTLTMAAYHIFFGLFILDLNYKPSAIGIFTIASVLSEVILFHYSGKILGYFSPFRLLTFTYIFTSLRWFVLAYFHDFYSILFSQMIHAVSWGLFFIVSIRYTEYRFKDRLRTSGITLFSAVIFGLGNSIGFYISGLVRSAYGNKIMFIYCGFLSLLTFLISLYLSLKEDKTIRIK